MVKAFRIYGQDSDTGISEGTLIQNIDVMHDNIDDDDEDDDNVLTLRQFPESFEGFEKLQLPNHERCATHTLHLIASQDMDKARSQSKPYKKNYDTAMAKCRAVWNLCSRSPKACEVYLESTGKSPTSPCPTRWNSYYNCIQDLLAVKGTLNETLKKLGLAIFKEIEIQFLLEYVSCSKPIADGIRSLEGDKDIYYGCLIPELMRMQRILSSLKMDNLTYCDVLIDVIKESLNRRFERFYKLEEPKAKDGIIASVSYPFFKMKWVPKANREYIKDVFVSEVRKIKQEDEKSSQVQHTDSDKKKERTESYMFVEDSDSSAASDNVNTTTIDLETLQYLKDEDNTLESLNRYPNVKKLFLKYNTCLPSSAPVERLFSFGDEIGGAIRAGAVSKQYPRPRESSPSAARLLHGNPTPYDSIGRLFCTSGKHEPTVGFSSIMTTPHHMQPDNDYLFGDIRNVISQDPRLNVLLGYEANAKI
ncbi:hypothetical protein EVAR_20027_1 [Eumeta japonica]|uniref:Zinc finger BED domain-containing protein 4 n=1 Tax=Eumeta variegata TaxID=151549 RepID=A0A4C1VB64_EUMVA|nr:hypothetical protein EVAR_20027_1 [Eumeta japonica]